MVQLLPFRASDEQNSTQERKALIDAGYDVRTISAPMPGARGILWLDTTGARLAARLEPDIVMARDLDTLGAAFRVKKRIGAKIVYDVHEVYPWMIQDDVPSFVVSAAIWRERKLLPYADAIIASNLGIIDWLVKEQAPKDGIGLDDPITLVVNCRDPQPKFVPPETRALCYFGTFHHSRFIIEMVNAVKAHKYAQLFIAGPPTNRKLYEWVRANSDGVGVVFLGHLTPEEVLWQTTKAAIVVTMVNPSNPNNRIGLSNKLFDAMSVGRAAIGTLGTATGDLIATAKMGLTTVYDELAFARGIDTMLSDETDLERLGRNAYDMCVKEFNWTAQAKKLVDVFRGLE